MMYQYKQSKCIPQNDLDCYFNSQWQQLQKNNNHQSYFTIFNILQNNIDNEIYQFIIQAIPNSDPINNKLVQFRDSFFLSKEITKLDSIIKLSNLINRINNLKKLGKIIRILNNLRIPNIFTFGITEHHQTPDIYVLFLQEISLSLDVRKLNIYPELDCEIAKFEKFLQQIYQFIIYYQIPIISNENDFIKNIITFEILISKFLSSDKENNILPNSLKYDDFINRFIINDFWTKSLRDFWTKNTNFIIIYENEKYLDLMSFFLSNIDNLKMNMIKDYLLLNIIKKYGSYINCHQNNKNFNKLFPISNEKKYLVNLFYHAFGYYLENIYQEKYNDQEKNKSIYEMFEKIKSYCMMTFENNKIFERTTINEALKKLNKLDLIVGKQKSFVDFNNLSNLNNNFFDNLMIIDKFLSNESFKMIGCKINRNYLSLNYEVFSFILNAYQNPRTHIICIPTSMTSDIFFKNNIDPIDNYGGLGSIIGHEIIHCFDWESAYYDYLGHTNNWWSDNDYLKFQIELNKIIEHYQQYKINDLSIDAESTISENFADINGIKLSLRTYICNYCKKYYHQYNNLSIDDKNHLKKFFKKWAEIFRFVMKENYILKYFISSDIHAPNIIRINAPFSHISEYYQIFDVKPHHQNYLDPKLRSSFMD